jgi:arylsulfatase A-like enzyme
VVLITIDTLRYDHLSANTPDSPAKTPNMDRIATDGIRFTQAWSPISVTGPAFASMLTGKHPTGHGVLMNTFKGGKALDAEHETLAEMLKTKGYTTGAFVSGFTLRADVGLNQGFDVYDAPEEKYRRWSKKTVEAATAWLAETEGPVFLWLHSYDPHGPLKRWKLDDEETRAWKRAPKSTISPHQRIEDIVESGYYKRKYTKAVEFSDEQVGTLLSDLSDSGRYEGALIVLTADHGEGFDERDVWFEHGSNAYAEQLQIPMFVKMPGNTDAGSRKDEMVSLMDIVPTVRAAAGLPKAPGLDGLHMMTGSGHSQLDGESSHCKPMAFVDCTPQGGAGKVLASRTASQTLIRKSTSQGERYERYNRNRDPTERSPDDTKLTEPGSPLPPLGPPELLNPLDTLRQHRTTVKYAPLPDKTADVDAEEIEKLKALGYVQ